MPEIATQEPLQFTVGETVSWTKEFDGYSAADGWELNYHLINSSGKLSLVWGTEISADGSGFLIEIPAATTETYEAGTYSFQAWLDNAGEKVLAASGQIEIRPSFASLQKHDFRSHARIVLDNIQAVLQKTATLEQKSYSIDGRSLEKIPLPELLALRDVYRAEVRAEDAAGRVAAGLDSGKKLKLRFV